MPSTAEVEAEDMQTDELYRKFQGILNKLTPTNFQKLAEQALSLDITTEARLSGCIDKIFTKVSVVGLVGGWGQEEGGQGSGGGWAGWGGGWAGSGGGWAGSGGGWLY